MKLSQFVTTVEIDDGVLLFNSLNTALLRLSALEYEEMQQFLSQKESSADNQPCELIKELISMGFIIECDRNEFVELERRYWDFRNSSDYIKVVIAPTSSCNFSCIYCFENGNRASSMTGETAQEIAQKIISKLQHESVKGLMLTWYGGEPLLSWEIICQISTDLLSFCKSKGVLYNACIISNGYMLSPQKIQELKEMGCTAIQITIDGDASLHNKRRPLKNGGDTFEQILKSIVQASKKLHTTVRVNVDRENLDSVKRLIEKLGKINIPDVAMFFARVEPFNDYSQDKCFSAEEFSTIEIDLLSRAVAAGFRKCVALPTPNFGFCEAVSKDNMLFDPDGDYFFCWENVGRKELTSCRSCHSEKYRELRNYFLNTYSFCSKKCKTCSVLPLCLGGCPQRKLETGNSVCPPILYNLPDLLKLYYNVNYINHNERGT